MNLSELLDELRNNILRDTSSAVTDVEEDQLWSDAALVRYINDAQNKFARRTRCIRDSTTAKVVEIELEEGVEYYPMHASVIGVMTASTATTPLRRTMEGTLNGAPADIAAGTYAPMRGAQGAPTWFSTDDAVRTLRIIPIPDAASAGTIVRLRVERLPLNQLDVKVPTGVPEIPVDYHIDMLEWAAFRAYRNHDVDAENTQKANSHRAAFNTAVDEVKRDIKLQALSPIQFGIHARY